MHTRALPLFLFLRRAGGADFALCLLWAVLSLGLGWALNAARRVPLPLRYTSREERLWAEVTSLNPTVAVAAAVRSTSPAELAEQLANSSSKPLLLDARPEVFYELGHLPGALSLPRESFRVSYERQRTTLERARNQPLLIYCQGADCQDSQLVAAALGKLGFTNLTILLGGWEAWEKVTAP